MRYHFYYDCVTIRVKGRLSWCAKSNHMLPLKAKFFLTDSRKGAREILSLRRIPCASVGFVAMYKD